MTVFGVRSFFFPGFAARGFCSLARVVFTVFTFRAWSPGCLRGPVVLVDLDAGVSCTAGGGSCSGVTGVCGSKDCVSFSTSVQKRAALRCAGREPLSTLPSGRWVTCGS